MDISKNDPKNSDVAYVALMDLSMTCNVSDVDRSLYFVLLLVDMRHAECTVQFNLFLT